MLTRTLLTAAALATGATAVHAQGLPLALAVAPAAPAVSSSPATTPTTDPQPTQGCYVPTSGTVYVIGLPNTPATCRTGHTPITLQGPIGPAGPAGPQGPAGPPGSAAFPTLEYVTVFQIVDAGFTANVTATCPAGTKVLNGGWNFLALFRNFLIEGNGPTADGTGWRVKLFNREAVQSQRIDVFAICVPQ